MSMPPLDATDQRLIDALRRNARITNRALASLLGLSPSATLARLRKLERLGAIRGYTVVLSPAFDAPKRSYFIEVELDRHDEVALHRFEALLHASEEVRMIIRASGPYDYLIHLVSALPGDWTKLAAAAKDLGVQIRRSRSVEVVETVKTPSVGAFCTRCRQKGQADGAAISSRPSCD